MNKFLRKQADFSIAGGIAGGLKTAGEKVMDLLSKIGDKAVDVGVDYGKVSGKALLIGAPATALALSYVLAKLNSPEAVADNAHNYAINAVMDSSLNVSKKDLANLLAMESLKNNNKHHDQYI